MSSAAPRVADARTIVTELWQRQPLLAGYGITLLLLAIPVSAMTWQDPRLLDNGLSPWVKPVKFLVSVGLFSLTASWFFGYVRPERRRSRAMRTTVTALIVSGSFELFWISWQAAHGVDSHFNTGTLLDTIMFGLMGLFALVLTATTLPLAWEIGRRPARGLEADYVAAVAAGLTLTWLIGTGTGVLMSVYGSHAVGLEGQGLPLVGWNRTGGDLRVAHFLGMHAEQLIPIGAALMAGFAARLRWRLLIAGCLLYLTVTLAVLAQALAGQPLLPA